MLECDLQTMFGRELDHDGGVFSGPEYDGGCAWELKLKRSGRALPCDAVEPHQSESLIRAGQLTHEPKLAGAGSRTGCGLRYKLTDLSAGIKPFDCFYLRGIAVARLMLGWWSYSSTAHTVKVVRVYEVEVADWLRLCSEARARGRKSVTEASVKMVARVKWQVTGGKWLRIG